MKALEPKRLFSLTFLLCKLLKQSYVTSYAYMVMVPDSKPTPAWITAHWKQYTDQMRSGDETNACIAMSLYEIITHKCYLFLTMQRCWHLCCYPSANYYLRSVPVCDCVPGGTAVICWRPVLLPAWRAVPCIKYN